MPCLLALLLVVPVVPVSQTPASAPTAPRLLVLIAVDQFRADYPATYGRYWTGGLHRLFTRGAVFARAVTPWAITRTCNGHASIGTGALPSTHGVIANEWYDRQQQALVTCTSDPAVTPLGLAGRRATEQHSARWLQAPTLAEELRRQAAVPPRIVSIALKARAAIGLAGRGGDGTVVVWEEDSGTWATSSAYASAPWPVVDTYLAAHSPDAARGTLWQRLMPASQYLYDDLAAGEPARGRVSSPPRRGVWRPVFGRMGHVAVERRVRRRFRGRHGRTRRAGTARRHRRSNHRLLGTRLRGPYLRPAQPRSAGRARPVGPVAGKVLPGARPYRWRRPLRRRVHLGPRCGAAARAGAGGGRYYRRSPQPR